MRKSLTVLLLGASAIAIAGCQAMVPAAYAPEPRQVEAKPAPVVRRAQPPVRQAQQPRQTRRAQPAQQPTVAPIPVDDDGGDGSGSDGGGDWG